MRLWSIHPRPRWPGPIEVTTGQVQLEWSHLLAKQQARSPQVYAAQARLEPAPHPRFVVVEGPVAPWERAVGAAPGG